MFTQVAAGWQSAAPWVNTTRYCKYSQVLLMMGENIGRTCWQPAATWVNTTRYCKYSQVLLTMGENIALPAGSLQHLG
jgi:hypothetical protein